MQATTNTSAAPARAGLVLAALILVAAVANLNLAVANVALPDIGKAFDAGQTALNLVAVGYSLGLAASVLYLGALGDRYGRKLMLVLGTALSIPACLLAAFAPSIEVLFAARLLGGLAAGMAYPDDAGADHGAVVRAGAHEGDRALVGARRGDRGARSAALRARCSSSSSGARSSWSPCRWRWWRCSWPCRFVPAHVNETTEPVDNLGGILSVAAGGGARAGHQLRARARARARWRSGSAASRSRRGRRSSSASAARAHPLYDLEVAGRRIFWVAACAGIIVFGTLMGAMFVGQQFLQNVLGYSTLDAGLGDPARGPAMVLVAPRSAKLVRRAGARFTLLSGTRSACSGSSRCSLLWKEGISYWKVGLGYAFIGIGVGFAGTPASHSLTGSVPVTPCRDGVRHRRPPARPGRRDHAVDPRRGAHRGLCGRRRERRSPARRTRQDQRRASQTELTKSFSSAADTAEQLSAVRRPDHRRGEDLVPAGRRLGLHRRDRGDSRGRGPGVLLFPKHDRERELLAQYHAEDIESAQAAPSPHPSVVG